MDQIKPVEPAPAVPAAQAAGRPLLPAWLMAVLLALLTIALYWPALSNDFVTLDDPDYVTSNAHVQGGLTLASLQWAFTSFVGGNWHPVTMLSHMLDCQLYGLKPWGHHLTNVLLHALNTALVFLLLRRMTGAVWRSALVAALFAAHPLHVESVAWVAERKDVLSVFFGLLAMLFYVRFAQAKMGPRPPALGTQPSALDSRPSALGYYSLALLFFALGLMSKSMLVTLPFVLLLLDYWPLGRITNYELRITNLRPLLLEKVPFFVLAAASSVMTVIAQRQGGAVITAGDFPPVARLENALFSYCRYLGKLCWPTDLAVFYPHANQWPLEQVLAAGILLCGITALCVWGRRRWPFLVVGWLWFGGTLVPVIGFVQVGKQAIADRYMYIPSLGVFILAVWGAYELTRRWRQQAMGLSAAGLAVIASCVLLTRQQLRYWKDSETLFRHTLAVTKDNFVTHYNLGVVLSDQGRTEEAVKEFQETVRLAPIYADAHVNLGVVLLREGRADDAIAQIQQATQLKPDNANAHFNLGVAFYQEGQVDDAITEFQADLRLKPDDADAQNRLAQAMALKQKLDALASDPAALNNAAWELATNPDARVRNGALAVKLAERACEQTQYRVTMMVGTLAAAYAEAGRYDEAVATAQKACALAEAQGETNLLARNRELTALYQKHQPYHEPATKEDGR